MAKPPRQPRRFNVFLDTDDIPAGGALPQRLADGLFGSKKLILLVSEASAGSTWVGVEMERWLSRRDATDIILGVVEGDLRWDQELGRWTDSTKRWLPEALHRAFADEPNWVDLREYAEISRIPIGSADDTPEVRRRLSLDDAAFKWHVARIQAPLVGPDTKPSDIVGEDLDIHRAEELRRRRRVQAIVGLAVLAIILGAAAVVYGLRSAAQAREALARQVAAQSADRAAGIDLGPLLAVEAFRIDRNTASEGALVGAAARLADVDGIGDGHERTVRTLAVSADGRWLASGDGGGRIVIRDAASVGDERSRIEVADAAGQAAVIVGLQFSPVEPVLFAAGRDGVVRSWNVADPASPVALPSIGPVSDAGRLSQLAVAPDGSAIVVGGGVDDAGACTGGGMASVVEVTLDDGAQRILGEVNRCVYSLAVSSRGDRIGVGDARGLVHLLPIGDGHDVGRVSARAHGSGIRALAFDPDGERLASAGTDGEIKVWSVEGLESARSRDGESAPMPIVDLDQRGLVRSIVFSPDGDHLATGNGLGAVHLFDPTTGSLERTMSGVHSSEIRAVAFDPTGRRLYSAGGDTIVVAWRLERRTRAVSTIDDVPDARAAAVDRRGVAFVAGGRYGPMPEPPPGYLGPVLGDDGDLAERRSTSSAVFALDAHGGVLAAGQLDGSVVLVDAMSGEVIRTVDPTGALCGDRDADWQLVRSVALGRRLVIGYANGAVVVVDPDADPLDVRCHEVTGRALAVALRPSGDLVAASNGDERVLLWSLSEDDRRLVPGPAELVHSVAFSGDGSLLVAGGAGGGIALVDPATGEQRGSPLAGHIRPVLSLAFAADGSRLASGADDGTVVLWDLETGLPITSVIETEQGAIRDLAWADGDEALVVVGAGATAVWHLRPAELIDVVCEVVGREPTAREWAAYFPTRSQRTVCDAS